MVQAEAHKIKKKFNLHIYRTPQELPQQLLRRPPAMNSSIPQLPEDEDVNWSSEKFDRFSTMHE